MSANKYGGLIWTNHALERLTQRGLPQDLAWQAYRYPDEVQKDPSRNSITYTKQHYAHKITLIVKENERRELIVISAWMDPPMLGTEDHRKNERYKQYKKASFMGKLWHGILGQLGF
jgi:hypothetical protein